MAINIKMGEPSRSSLKALIEFSPNLKSMHVNWCSYNLLSLFDLTVTTMNIIGVGNISNFRYLKIIILQHPTGTNYIVLFALNFHFSLQDTQILLQRNKHTLERSYTPQLWDNTIIQNQVPTVDNNERDLKLCTSRKNWTV